MSAGDDNGGRAVFFHGATASEVAPEVDVEEPATTTWLCVTSTSKTGVKSVQPDGQGLVHIRDMVTTGATASEVAPEVDVEEDFHDVEEDSAWL